MKHIHWGIIGCGDVAEKKSGPAFQHCKNSSLLAVMRRNKEKAKAFAERHHVPKWYADADELLKNKEIDAVYIATPPSTHLHYALKALAANKHVYLEKPMALNKQEATAITKALSASKAKLTVAHYRRRLPAFSKIKELVTSSAIGKIIVADIQILQSKKSAIVAHTEEQWRLNPDISGGGYFHDLAPHQLDFMYYLFGDYEMASGTTGATVPAVADVVNGSISFKNGTQFNGLWCFNLSAASRKERCVLHGETGKITFSFYGEEVTVEKYGEPTETFTYVNPVYVQLPMIQATVDYFLGKSDNPCAAYEGVVVMELMDAFTK